MQIKDMSFLCFLCAPPLSTSTPKKSSSCLLHTKTHSAHPSSVTHTAPNSPSPHTSPPSPLKPLPPSPSSLHAAHGGTHAHATGPALAMPCSRLLSASPQFTHTISTINSITTTNTTTTTIKSADQPIHHLLPRHQRHRLHPMQPTRHPLLSFTPVSTSNPLPTSFSTLTSSYFIPSPPQSSLPHPPPSPTPLPLPHCRTDADADGATTAMACSSLLTANPNLNYMTSTLKTIKPNYTSATTIPLLIHFSHGPFHHASHHQHHYHPAHNFPQLHSRMYPHCSPPTP
nr:hypothetical transcript [Hymenolepis microstoma]